MSIKLKSCDCSMCNGARSLDVSLHLGPVWFNFNVGQPGFDGHGLGLYTSLHVADILDGTYWLFDIERHNGRRFEIESPEKPHWYIRGPHFVENLYHEDQPDENGYYRMYSSSEWKAKKNEEYAEDYKKRTGKTI